MASIRKEITLDARPDDVWDALRDFGALHERLVPGFVVDARVDGDTRVITFFNGAVARERLVGIDDSARRLAYAVVESGLGFTHHSAAAQVLSDGDGSRFVWISDLLPDERAPQVDALMERGIAAVRDALDGART
ncbi:MAG TPA: SRPBCC family protein [Acidimicrobiia bacterium]|nr:SRPBCC family protein [Acidimicrobiia bacterium]